MPDAASSPPEPMFDLPTFMGQELRLFLACARGPAAASEIRALLIAPINWELLVHLVQREHAASVVCSALVACAEDLLPSDLLTRLRHMSRVNEFRMAYLQQRLTESASALAGAGIPCVLLKGAALATAVYGSFSQRSMVDIDLLVPRDLARDALRTLLDTGWKWVDPRNQEDDFSHLCHLPALVDARGMNVSLELHTDLITPGHPFALSPEMVFEDAAPAATSIPVLIPSPSHMLLHTCIHFAWAHMFRKHGWRALRDVRAIIEWAPIDWNDFLDLANRTRARTCCYWTFRLTRELLGPVVPDDVLTSLRQPAPERLLRLIGRHCAVVLFPSEQDCPSARMRRWLWTAAVLPHWSGHGNSRPWEVNFLTPEGRAKRGLGDRGVGFSRLSQVQEFARYARGVLLGSKRGIRRPRNRSASATI